ncbi:MAG: hypothetical protein Q8934_21990 [Bacillota bacterium]|nr:hypothetical protein [Bacillota bacterium]
MKKATLVHKPKDKYPMLKNGDIFFVKPTESGQNTHYYFYDLNGVFQGCFPVDWFELQIDQNNSKSKKMDKFEQLSLF